MISKPLVHDHACVLAMALVEIILPCVRPEQEEKAFTLFYAVCKTGIEEYERKADRIRKRIKPSRN